MYVHTQLKMCFYNVTAKKLRKNVRMQGYFLSWGPHPDAAQTVSIFTKS